MTSAESLFKKITIVGLGLIGGSWAKALQRNDFPARRVGFDRPEVLDQALASGAIHERASNLADGLRDADLVILSTPVGSILDLLGTVNPLASPSALVTDTGSTKRLIVERARKLFSGRAKFLGGHPIAGKEQSGFAQSEDSIFQNACYVLTPLSGHDSSDERVKAFVELIELTGAHACWMEAAAHDIGAAFLSHLPQLLSSGLASLAGEQAANSGLPLELAGSGFRSVTRLAASPYNLWRDISLTNSANIHTALDAMIQKLEQIKTELTTRALESEFTRARELRNKVEKS